MDFDKITNYLNSVVDDGIPSVDLIISKNHEQLFRYMKGNVDADKKVPVADDQRYLMFSMTKIQTMTAFMQLVEREMLSLDDEVAKYLPAYDKLMIKDANGNVSKCTDKLRLWHLVSMQSGLDYDLKRPGIVKTLAQKGMNATTREIVDSFVQTPLDFAPGTHFCYSLSHDVVAAVIEVVSGMKFSEYLRENIWEPLGMKDTFFAKPLNDNVDRLARQFEMKESGEIVPMEQTCDYQLSDCYESGGAGLISCTNDYALFGDALACGGIGVNGNRILKPESIETIKQNLLNETSLQEIADNMGRTGYGYGCGMQVLMHPELLGSPAPKGVFGWDGAAGSILQMETQSQISFVYTMHVRNCGPAYGTIHPTLRDLIFE